MVKRFFALSALLYMVLPSVSNAQKPALIFQEDTVVHSVVGRLVWGMGGYQNSSYTRSLRIKDMYFAHQADSIFICDTKFNVFDFVLVAQSFSSLDYRFRSPKFATTVYDTLVTVCEWTDAPGNIFYVTRPYIGFTTTDSSSDSSRLCVYAHDCDYLSPINLGDTARGLLCYELENIPNDSIYVTSIHFTGRDSASFHLVDSSFPKGGYAGLGLSGRIGAPYVFIPARYTGVKRYAATAIAKMTSSDGVLCHEADIDVQGLLNVPVQDSIGVGLFGTDSLALHFTIDSTIFKHVLEFQNNSSQAVKIDNAYMKPGDCFAMDNFSPPYGTKLDSGAIFYVNIHYNGDSTSAGNDCSDTHYTSLQRMLCKFCLSL